MNGRLASERGRPLRRVPWPDEVGRITGANVMGDGGMSSIDGAEPVIVTPTS
jgi:hypothetical protein